MVSTEKGGDGRNGKAMRNMQKLATEKDRSCDGSSEAGDMRARPGVDVLPAAVRVREAQGGGRSDGSGAAEVAFDFWTVFARGGFQ